MSLQHDIDVSQNFTARVFKSALAILSKNALILSFLHPFQCFHGNLRTWCLETYDLFAIVVEMFSGLEGLHWASSTVQVIKHIKLFHISSCRIVCFETDPSTKHLESFKVLCILISNPFNMMEGFFRPLKISV